MKTKSLLTLAVLTAVTTFGLTVSANSTDSTTTAVADGPIKLETTTIAAIADGPFKVEDPKSTADGPFLVQSETPSETPTTAVTTTTTAPVETTLPTTEPAVQSQLNTAHPSISQIRILPFTTIYVADETVTEGQEKIVQIGVDGRESVTKTYIDGEIIIDVEVLQEMVMQVVHVHPNDVRVALDRSFNNTKPIPEPTPKVNPFASTETTTVTTTTVAPAPHNNQITSVETTTVAKTATTVTLPKTGETSNLLPMLLGVTILSVSVFAAYKNTKKQN